MTPNFRLRHHWLISGLAAVLAVLPLRSAANGIEAWADEISKARSRLQPLPAIGARSSDATENTGYRVQRVLIDRAVAAGDVVIGHKAGLMTEEAQARFGLLEPVAGTLLKSHLKPNATFVGLRQNRGVMIELELGFELKLSIRQEPADIEELKSAVRQVVPVVELPALAFAAGARPSGADVIAANVGAATVIVGQGQAVERLDPNAVRVRLERDGSELTTGRGSDVMDDQWRALLWLVRQRLREGYEVKRNDLLITGAMGTVVEGAAGRYVADFGSLGRITFVMR